jgi:hypothetical protein
LHQFFVRFDVSNVGDGSIDFGITGSGAQSS